MKNFCTAQLWGSGPISKLSSILNANGLKANFEYINTSSDLYKYFIEPSGVSCKIDSLENLTDTLAEGKLLLSVMNPELAIIASIMGLKVIYVDSLTWFWKIWDEVSTDYYKCFLNFKKTYKGRPQEALNAIKFMNLYDIQWAAHLLSDVSIVQQSFPLGSKAKKILNLKDSNCYVGTLVDERFNSLAEINPENVIVNLGGCFSNPMYKELMIEIFRRVADVKSNYNFSIVTSSNTKSKKVSKNLAVKSFSRGDYINLLNRTDKVFSPPGLTFLLESSLLGNTTFLLPYQHAGQIKNTAKTKMHMPSLPGITFEIDKPNLESIVEHTRSLLNNEQNINYYANHILASWDNIPRRNQNKDITNFIKRIGEKGTSQAVNVINEWVR